MRIGLGMAMAVLMAVLIAAGPVRAQEAVQTPPVPSNMPVGLSDKMFRRMRSAPEAFVADAAGLILGYGVNEGIDPAGIDRAIAVDRAAARGRDMGRMMQADLDGDGSASAGEVAVLVQATSAKGRGRVALSFEAADVDKDGTVTFGEMQAHAVTAGEEAVSPGKASALRGMMVLDLDSDGVLTLIEVREAVKRAQEGA